MQGNGFMQPVRLVFRRSTQCKLSAIVLSRCVDCKVHDNNYRPLLLLRNKSMSRDEEVCRQNVTKELLVNVLVRGSVTSASSLYWAIRSAAPLVFKTRATASWILQSTGSGNSSLCPSGPLPSKIWSPSRKRIKPGPGPGV